MKISHFFGTLSLAALSFTASGQTTPGVTTRQGVQHERIQEGRASGELTRRESRELRRQQRRVQTHKEIAKSDGVVTRNERRSLKAHQNAANRNIARKKHNARDRN